MSDRPRKASDPAFRVPPGVLSRFRDSQSPPADVEEVLELAEEAIVGPRDDETRVPCPSCESCMTCKGTHMVSPAVRVKALSGVTLDDQSLDESGEGSARGERGGA